MEPGRGKAREPGRGKESWLQICPPCSLSSLELNHGGLEVISGKKLGVNIDSGFGAYL